MNKCSKETRLTNRYALYEVRRRNIPQRLGEFATKKEARELVAPSRAVSYYLFDTKLGREGRSSALVNVWAHGLTLTTDKKLNRKLKFHDSERYIDWSGRDLSAYTGAKYLPSDWSQEDAATVDFLHLRDKHSLRDFFKEHPEKACRPFIDAELDRMAKASGLDKKDMSQYKHNGDYTRFAEAHRAVMIEILRALPTDQLFNPDAITYPGILFTKFNKEGNYRGAGFAANAMSDYCNFVLRAVWSSKSSISLGELAYKALAFRSVGIDIVEPLGLIYSGRAPENADELALFGIQDPNNLPY